MAVMYRPPFESASLLLEVTHGCSHNACTFCTMYRGVQFGVVPEDEVERQIEEFARRRPRARRVFLENGDAFVLGADRLLRIADMVHGHLEAVGTITAYASVNNIASKSDAELRALAEAGINDLNVGVESGYDPALEHMNKGYTSAEALEQLQRVRSAGMDFAANLILGIAGTGGGHANAQATARLMNAARPSLVFTGTIHSEPGCPLYDEMASGAFVEPTVGEYLDEEEEFLALLDLPGCHFFGLHPSNVVLLEGRLNEDRDRMLEKIGEARVELSDELGSRPSRGAEGMVGL